MPQVEEPPQHLTDYERAICYYTLPRVVSPVTYGAVMVYAVLILQAVAVMAYGLACDKWGWFVGGVTALCWLIVLGTVLFTARALLNDVRRKRMLAVAEGVPDAVEESPDIPDPFSSHMLIRHPLAARGRLFACTEDDSTLLYSVDSSTYLQKGRGRRSRMWWNVRTPHDAEYCHIEIAPGVPSFSMDPVLPGRVRITVDKREVATIRPKFSLKSPTAEIRRIEPKKCTYLVKRDSIYAGDRLVGRIYVMRQALYLDIERSHLNEGILAYFILHS